MIGKAARARRILCVDEFGDAAAGLDSSFRKLLACEPITYDTKPRGLPNAVVYLFSERGDPAYVGRSNTFSQRLGNHCRPGSQGNQASLAFRYACDEVQYVRPKYQRGQTYADALRDVPGLADAFEASKRRLRLMEIRYVAEDDQVRQALLEMYAALALGLAHDFGTH